MVAGVVSEFDPGGFSNVDASRSPADYSANLDRAQAIWTIVENRLLVRDALGLDSGDAVLDVGSGNGEEVQAIAETGKGGVVGPAAGGDAGQHHGAERDSEDPRQQHASKLCRS